MSNNVEFISAAALPTTEAEEVDVLCVENGELKRKAGATLGGGGGGSFVLRPTLEDFGSEGACTANYDEMAKALEAGSHVSIVFPAGLLGDGYPTVLASVLAAMYVAGQGLVAYVLLGEEPMSVLFTNGTYEPVFG